MSLSKPFHALSPDTILVIFTYHIHTVPNTAISAYAAQDMLFMRRFVSCVSFQGVAKFSYGEYELKVNVEGFLDAIGGSGHVLQYLDLSQMPGLTDDTFSRFQGISHINLAFTYRCSYTPDAFQFLKDVQYLNLSTCSPSVSPAEIFRYLGNVHTLLLCENRHVTGEGFEHLKSCKTLNLHSTPVTYEAFRHLSHVEELDMTFIRRKISPPFKFLSSVRRLRFSWVNSWGSDSVFRDLLGIEHITIEDVNEAITPQVFAHLSGVRHLEVILAKCYPCVKFPSQALVHLKGIECLRVTSLDRMVPECIAHLIGIRELHMDNLTDEVMPFLCSLTTLRTSSSHLTDLGLLELVNVEDLHIEEAHSITDDGLMDLHLVKTLTLGDAYRVEGHFLRRMRRLDRITMMRMSVASTAYRYFEGIRVVNAYDCGETLEQYLREKRSSVRQSE